MFNKSRKYIKTRIFKIYYMYSYLEIIITYNAVYLYVFLRNDYLNSV